MDRREAGRGTGRQIDRVRKAGKKAVRRGRQAASREQMDKRLARAGPRAG